jgi:hypothetical protein
MKVLGASIAGLCVSVALAVAPAYARPAHAPTSRTCCRVPAGTVVQVELADPVSTKVQKSGDAFALRLAEPLVINGRLVLRAGTPGVGEVVQVAKPGLGGKGAKLVLAARYLGRGHTRVALQGLQMSSAGHDNSKAAQAVGLTGIAFAPLGFIGLAVRGGDVELPAGTIAIAKVASNIYLPSLGPAPRGVADSAAEAAEPQAEGVLNIPPPPAGKGQVVFFRGKSLLGTAQWFNVRESGKALGKLTNGAYFIQITDPGQHAYTATTEPELKDHLTLEVDAGETYYVEGTLTKGVVIGTANISPSNRAAFDKAAKDLKLAPPVLDEQAETPPEGRPADATATAPVSGPNSGPSSGPGASAAEAAASDTRSDGHTQR